MALPWLLIYGSYALKMIIPCFRKLSKDSPAYRISEKEESISVGNSLPIVYGFNKVGGHIIYQEDTTDPVYDMAVGFCEGEVESIERIRLDGKGLRAPTTFTSYLGTSMQDPDDIFKKGTFFLPPVADAWVWSKYPSETYNTTHLYTSNLLNSVRHTYIKFDLSSLPRGFTMTENCSIRLDCSGAIKHNVYGWRIKPEDENWSEFTINWNNKPSSTIGRATVDDGTTVKSGEVFSFKISKYIWYVQEAYDNNRTVTFCFKSVVADEAVFNSKEGSGICPFLVIEFSNLTPCAFRNTAYIAMHVNATKMDLVDPLMPEVSARIKGRNTIKNLVVFPDWSGWFYSYSNNPIWEVRDLLTNSRYGLGWDESALNINSFISSAAYCDELVTAITAEGNEITEKRYECDIVLDTQRSARENINDILATCAGYLYYIEGKLCVGLERPLTFDENTQSFKENNIIEGSFSFKETEINEVPNLVRIAHTDVLKDFKVLNVQVSNDLDQEIKGILLKESTLYGINRRSQATRLANFILLKSFLCKYACRFKVSINNCWISVNDPCYVTHPVPGWVDKKFKVIEMEEYSNDEIQLICESYDELLFTDQGIEEDFSVGKIAPPNPYGVPDITALTLTEVLEEETDGSIISYINVAFTIPTEVGPWKYLVWWKKAGGNYLSQFSIFATSSPVRIPVFEVGSYYVKVQTYRDSPYLFADFDFSPESSITLVGQSQIPPIPEISSFTWTDGSGKAVWSTGVIVYKGKKYIIASGETTNAYIYFDPDISITLLQTSANRPTIGANTWVLAYYNSIDDEISLAESKRILHAGLLQAHTITANEIMAGTITADMIYAGTISSKVITLAITPGQGDCFIGAGKTDFTNAQTGFILGLDDSDADTPKFYIGSSTKYLNWDGATLTVSGSLNTGAGSSIETYYLLGTIPQANLNLADRGWSQACVFTVTDADTVAWAAGIFTSADGTAYNIAAGNTGNMTAKTYIYLNIAVSTTAYQLTTTATTAVGVGKVLIAVAQNAATTATFALTETIQIVGDNILVNTIDASKIVTGQLVVGTNVGLGTAQDSAGVTTIVGNTITTSFVNALAVTVLGAVTAGSLSGVTMAIGSANNIFKADTNGIYLGNATFASAPFRVSMAGALITKSAIIGNWSVNSTSIYTGTEDHSGYTANAGDITIYSDGSDSSIHAKNFYIDTLGNLTCTSATVTGTIRTAVSGKRIELSSDTNQLAIYDVNGNSVGELGDWSGAGGILGLLFPNTAYNIQIGVLLGMKLSIAGETGDIYTAGSISMEVNKTVDGRDVSVDGVKLDGIEASADKTDADNVIAAGAIMDGDFTSNGVMRRTAAGAYAITTGASGSFLTSATWEITVSNGIITAMTPG